MTEIKLSKEVAQRLLLNLQCTSERIQCNADIVSATIHGLKLMHKDLDRLKREVDFTTRHVQDLIDGGLDDIN